MKYVVTVAFAAEDGEEAASVVARAQADRRIPPYSWTRHVGEVMFVHWLLDDPEGLVGEGIARDFQTALRRRLGISNAGSGISVNYGPDQRPLEHDAAAFADALALDLPGEGEPS